MTTQADVSLTVRTALDLQRDGMSYLAQAGRPGSLFSEEWRKLAETKLNLAAASTVKLPEVVSNKGRSEVTGRNAAYGMAVSGLGRLAATRISDPYYGTPHHDDAIEYFKGADAVLAETTLYEDRVDNAMAAARTERSVGNICDTIGWSFRAIRVVVDAGSHGRYARKRATANLLKGFRDIRTRETAQAAIYARP